MFLRIKRNGTVGRCRPRTHRRTDGDGTVLVPMRRFPRAWSVSFSHVASTGSNLRSPFRAAPSVHALFRGRLLLPSPPSPKGDPFSPWVGAGSGPPGGRRLGSITSRKAPIRPFEIDIAARRSTCAARRVRVAGSSNGASGGRDDRHGCGRSAAAVSSSIHGRSGTVRGLVFANGGTYGATDARGATP